MSVKKFPTYDKTHSATVVATAALAANRFVAADGGYASATPDAGNKLAFGVSETAAAVGDAIAVTTGFSQLVEAGEAITKGAFVQPGTDGKAAPGTIAKRCGVAASAATAAGQLIEVVLTPHIYTA